MIQVFTNVNFDLMGRVKWFFIAFSTLAAGVAVAMMLTRGFNYGIDFAGGTAVRVKFRDRPQIEEMRTSLQQAGLGDISIQNIGDPEDNEVLIRVELPQAAGEATGSEGGEISRKVMESLESPEWHKALQAGKLDLNMITESDLREWLGQHLSPSPA